MSDNGIILNFDDPAHRKAFNLMVKGLRGLHRVSIKQARRGKTLAQLAYVFGVCYPTIQAGLKEAWGETLSLEKVHVMMKDKFLSEPVVNHETGEVMGTTHVASLADLDIPQMCEYIDNLIKFSAEWLHAPIPPASQFVEAPIQPSEQP